MKKTNLLKAAVSLLLSATVLFTGCTALTDGVAGGDAVTVDGARSGKINGRKAFIYTKKDFSSVKDPYNYDYIIIYSLLLDQNYNVYRNDGTLTKSAIESWNKNWDKNYPGKEKPGLFICFGGGDKPSMNGSDSSKGYIAQAIDNKNIGASGLAKKIKKYLDDNYSGIKFAGIDVDWEYPSKYYAENGTKLYNLVAALRNKFDRVTIACDESPKYLTKIDKSTLKKIKEKTYMFNVMSYSSSSVQKAIDNFYTYYNLIDSSSMLSFGISIDDSEHYGRSTGIQSTKWLRDRWDTDGKNFGVMFWKRGSDSKDVKDDKGNKMYRQQAYVQYLKHNIKDIKK